MKFPPLKYNPKIPNALFYHRKSGPEKQYDLYNLATMNTGKKNGFLVLQKAGINIENYYQGRILFINYISSSPMYNGYGEIMLNFAKKIAKKNNCNGHIILKSDTTFSPNQIPHLFYRKNGFTSLDKKIDKKMDKFIKQGKPATHKDFPSLILYYPAPTKYPSEINKKTSLIDKIKNFFTNIFTK